MSFPATSAGDDADAGDFSTFDPNGTFDKSRSLAFGEDNAIIESITSRDDYDYFTFEGRAGQWVSITSETQSTVEVASTPLTLYDASHTQLAHNDYVLSIRGENVLSRLVVRLPSDGTYYLLVHDPGAASPDFGLVQSYRLILQDAAEATERFAIANDATADPTPVVFKNWSLDTDYAEDAFLLGEFSAPDDVEVFAFDVVSDAVRLATFEVELAGSEGNGSTATPAALWVTDSAGTNVIGRIDAVSGQQILGPPLAPDRYLLWVERTGGVAGDNDFFAVRALIRSENTEESEDTTNGELAGAESLDILQNGTESEAFLLAHVADQDVDYFRMDFTEGQVVSAYCGSSQEGSGVVGLHIELRNSEDTVIAEATESTSERVAMEDVPVPPAGVVYLRATKESQLEDVHGDWMHCGIYAY